MHKKMFLFYPAPPRFDEATEVALDWSAHAQIPPGEYAARDLWAHQDLDGTVAVPGDTYSGQLAAHANWAFRLTPV